MQVVLGCAVQQSDLHVNYDHCIHDTARREFLKPCSNAIGAVCSTVAKVPTARAIFWLCCADPNHLPESIADSTGSQLCARHHLIPVSPRRQQAPAKMGELLVALAPPEISQDTNHVGDEPAQSRYVTPFGRWHGGERIGLVSQGLDQSCAIHHQSSDLLGQPRRQLGTGGDDLLERT
jgi:hypothetical protein